MRIVIVGNGSTTSFHGEYLKDKHTARFLADLADRFEQVSWLEQVVESDSIDNNLHGAPVDQRIKLLNTRSSGAARFRRVCGLIRIVRSFVVNLNQTDFAYFYFQGTLSFLCALCAVFSRKPYGLYVRCDFYAASVLERLIVQKAAFVMVAGDEFRRRLRPLNPYIFQVAPMIDIEVSDIRDRQFDTDRPVKLLSVGRIEQAKGVYVLSEAFQKLNNTRSDLELHFVGGGPEYNKLKEVIETQAIGKAQVHGMISEKTALDRYYSGCDIFVFSSFHEGFPRVLYEAMAQSIPIITTPVGSIPSLMKDEENCLYVRPRDADHLVEQIDRLADDSELRKRLGRAGANTLKAFLSQFDGKRHADQVLDNVWEYVK